MKATSEAAFETLIVEHLSTRGGHVTRAPAGFDAELGLFPDDLLAYIRATQPKIWEKLEAIHHDKLGATLLAAFDKATATDGVLRILRHGFKFYGSTVRVASFRPAHGLSPEVEALYVANHLAVARQLHHDPKHPAHSLDLVLVLNGIPLVTAELKNAMTNQTADDARRQYQGRDPDAPIFRFKRRALIHFAVGSDEVWMAPRLSGTGTRFFPFNRGHGTGPGNPPIEGKHRTSYLWEEVWQRDSLLDIVARFIHLEVDDENKRERMVFPRYHQLDCVRKLVAATRVKGAGTNYLVQHSAGSGKSNSIGWLAHHLASLHDGQDRKVYDSVVVLTDRRVLDQQLQDTIYQIDHKTGVVRRIEEGKGKSLQLAVALADGCPIIVCTIHSFGAVAEKLEGIPNRRYAVIVDEAHSSQSGDMAANVKEILSAAAIAARFEEQAADRDPLEHPALMKAITRGPQSNLSFFAFTATPKFKTLELFGYRGEDGKPRPFHLYSMRQAIEEKFILDVLRGYTTYKSYFKLVKAVAEDPELDKKKASRALARFVSLHPTNIVQKTEVIIEHFRACVMNRIGGQAKAMVVTGSRLHAVKYKLAFDKYTTDHGYTDVGTLVAFSGEVKDPDNATSKDKPYTEPGMNCDRLTGRDLKESELPGAFAGDRYNVLIVANKYQTGFDQPLLCAMYVDKRLAGVQAVQTLSRLNRTHPGKTETFILDFVNDREEILESFQDYYEGTTVAESIDPQRLYELQTQLDGALVYHRSEVDHFAGIFFKPLNKQVPGDNGRLDAALNPAVDRFKALDKDRAEKFRDQLQAFCNLYSFLAQVVPFSDVDLEKLYAFGKKLLSKLPDAQGGEPVDLGDDVTLKYFRLQKTGEGQLKLAADTGGVVHGPTETGTAKQDEEMEKLSRLIDLVNERFGTDFDAQDLIDGVTDQLVADDNLSRAARVNDRKNFEFVGRPAFDEALVDRHAKHRDFIDRIFSEEDMLRFIRARVLDDVYRRLSGLSDPASSP